MQSISIFLDIAKSVDFPWKNVDPSRNQGEVFIIFGSCLGNV